MDLVPLCSMMKKYSDPPLQTTPHSPCPTDPWGLGRIRSHAQWGRLCGLRESHRDNNGPNVREAKA